MAFINLHYSVCYWSLMTKILTVAIMSLTNLLYICTTGSSGSSLSQLISLSSMPPTKIPSPSSSIWSTSGQNSLPEQHFNYPQILHAPQLPHLFQFPCFSFGNTNVTCTWLSWLVDSHMCLYNDES